MKKAITVTDVLVDNLSDDQTRAALHWKANGFRFHLRFNIEHWRANKSRQYAGQGTIFKSPLLLDKPNTHMTLRPSPIKLNARSGPSQAMLDQVWEQVEREDLVNAAIVKAMTVEIDLDNLAIETEKRWESNLRDMARNALAKPSYEQQLEAVFRALKAIAHVRA